MSSRFFFAVFVLWLCRPAALAAAAPADAPVVVDRVEVVGNPETPVDVLKSYLELPLGKPVDPAVLQEHLARFRLRLEALAFFKAIDLKLARGEGRGHVVIVVTLEAYGAGYAGLDVSGYRGKRGLPFLVIQGDGYDGKAFAGSRDVGGTGLMVDLQLEHQTLRINQSIIGSVTTSDSFTATIFHPGIAGTPYIAGVKATAGETELHLEGLDAATGGNSPVPDESRSRTWVAEGTLGRRFGLGSASLVGGWVGQSPIGTASPGSKYQSTYYGLLLLYSEKSHLQAVEPGVDLRFAAERVVSPAVPVMTAAAEWTYLHGNHALTPRVQGLYFSLQPLPVTFEQYQASLLYQWVSPWAWIFGAEPLGVFAPHTKNGYGISLDAQYVSASLLIKCGVAFGTLGLDFDDADARRGVLP